MENLDLITDDINEVKNFKIKLISFKQVEMHS